MKDERPYKGNDGNLMQHWTLCEVLGVALRHGRDLTYVDAHAMAPLATRQTETDAQKRGRFNRVRESLPGQDSIYERAWTKLHKGGGYPNSGSFLDCVWWKECSMLLCERDPLTVAGLREFERDHSGLVSVEAGDWRERFRRGLEDLRTAPLLLLSFDPYMYSHRERVKQCGGRLYPEDLRLVVRSVENLKDRGVIVQICTYTANGGNRQPVVRESIDGILRTGGFSRAASTRVNGHMMALVYSRGINWSRELAGLSSRFDAWLARVGR